MESHQPAAWLERPPAEAAEFLARTAVASRRVGGFVKRADWRETVNQLGTHIGPTAQNALIGAGVGGLGGLGLGMLDRKKRNPWATALTGATLGGLGGAAYTVGSDYLNRPDTGPTPDEIAQAAANAKKVRLASPAANLAEKFTRYTQRNSGIAPSDATKELDTIPTGDILKQQARDLPVLGGIFHHPVRSALGAAGAGVGEWAARSRLARLGDWRRDYQAFQQGWDQAKPSGDFTNRRGGPQPSQPQQFNPTEGLRELADAARARVEAPEGWRRAVPEYFREMGAGRALRRAATASEPVFGPGWQPPMPVPELTGSHVADALRAGRKAVPAPAAWGRAGRYGSGAATLGVQLGTQLLLNRLLGGGGQDTAPEQRYDTNLFWGR